MVIVENHSVRENVPWRSASRVRLGTRLLAKMNFSVPSAASVPSRPLGRRGDIRLVRGKYPCVFLCVSVSLW
jgi:hypothetical protein